MNKLTETIQVIANDRQKYIEYFNEVYKNLEVVVDDIDIMLLKNKGVKIFIISPYGHLVRTRSHRFILDTDNLDEHTENTIVQVNNLKNIINMRE